MHVIFNHGKESGPWGTKIQHLADLAKQQGCTVESIDYQDQMDPDKRVERLLQRIAELDRKDIVLAGSSMGGYVATVAASQVECRGLFVLAPAYYLGGYAEFDAMSINAPLHIVHGWHDDIVPVENSWRFAKQLSAPLTIVNDGHRLTDKLDEIEPVFVDFIKQLLT